MVLLLVQVAVGRDGHCFSLSVSAWLMTLWAARGHLFSNALAAFDHNA
jgi:hypothetical protein